MHRDFFLFLLASYFLRFIKPYMSVSDYFYFAGYGTRNKL